MHNLTLLNSTEIGTKRKYIMRFSMSLVCVVSVTLSELEDQATLKPF